MELNPQEMYTTAETQKILKVSSSTLKRFLKNGLIRANKVGGQYRIWGHEILRAISPAVDQQASGVYQKIKKGIQEQVKDW